MKKTNFLFILCLGAFLDLLFLGLAPAGPASTSQATTPAPETESCKTKNPPRGTNGWTNKGKMCKDPGARCGHLKVCADHQDQDFWNKINTHSCNCEGVSSAAAFDKPSVESAVGSLSKQSCG